jgi:hypothetical protein
MPTHGTQIIAPVKQSAEKAFALPTRVGMGQNAPVSVNKNPSNAPRSTQSGTLPIATVLSTKPVRKQKTLVP